MKVVKEYLPVIHPLLPPPIGEVARGGKTTPPGLPKREEWQWVNTNINLIIINKTSASEGIIHLSISPVSSPFGGGREGVAYKLLL
ncbi:hypothetical protein D0T84_08235 [Dysgonomonas sp. 521]|nr:hypothetical protein [Dysgonomonas sp. 521]